MRLQLLFLINICLLLNNIVYCLDQELLDDQTALDLQEQSDLDQLPDGLELEDQESGDQDQDQDLNQELEEHLQQELEAQDLNLMPKTLDTLGVDDSGNWVQKRVYWEQAEQDFGKIVALTAKISQLQLAYFGIRNDIDKILDASKYAIGMTLADLQKVADHLLQIGESQSNQENSPIGLILENQDKLKSLKKDLGEFILIDHEMDQVMIKVVEQVQNCNNYESKAWEDFKQIGRVLNDESAKKLYYSVVNYRKNIKLIFNYLDVDLKKSLDNLSAQAKKNIDQIQAIVDELHDVGLNLEYFLSDAGRDKNKSNQQQEQPKPAKKAPKKSGLWDYVVGGFDLILDILLWLPRKLFGLFGIKF